MDEIEVTLTDEDGLPANNVTLSDAPGVGPGSFNAPPFVTAFLNRKGGVGKTSCCHHLAGAFAGAGRRVLLVDADPQASLTKGLIGPERTEALSKEETLACIYDDA